MTSTVNHTALSAQARLVRLVFQNDRKTVLFSGTCGPIRAAKAGFGLAAGRTGNPRENAHPPLPLVVAGSTLHSYIPTESNSYRIVNSGDRRDRFISKGP